MEPREQAEVWLQSNIDHSDKEVIKELLKPGNESELEDAFYRNLEFGTGGLRGIMGIGSNRMNKYTVGMATQGMANYLKKQFPDQKILVVIAHDSRNNSRYFAEITSSVFRGNGIKVFLFPDLRPTPELSFAIRNLGCKSGVVITASHNPKEYNGFKAYWDDGAQITPPHDHNIIQEVKKIKKPDEIKFANNHSGQKDIGNDIDQLYLQEIEKLSFSPGLQKQIKIIYSPLHGTGIVHIPEILQKFGFKKVELVEEQSEPDGNFPTVVYPNPEEEDAMTLALKKAHAIDADLIMATDPDADRVGIAAKDQDGNYKLLNGNETGTLLLYYILSQLKDQNKLSGNEFIAKTVVTTDLIDRFSEYFGVTCYNTLTGFKYIAELIRKLEGREQFIAGCEESYGYMIGDFVRDKDAVAACALIAEMTAYNISKGSGLFEKLGEIYQQFGFYKEKLVSFTKKGKSGAREIKEMMNNFRENPPESINNSRLVRSIDYKTGVNLDITSREESKTNLPSSDVIQYFLEDGSKISIRPSGTEPKIKFYFSVNENLDDTTNFKKVDQLLEDRLNSIVKDLKLN